MANIPKGKGKGWLIAIVVIVILRLISVVGEKFSAKEDSSDQDSSYSEEKEESNIKELDGQEFAYANRRNSDRNDDSKSTQDKKEENKESSDTDSRGRSKDSSDSSTTLEYPLYTITMPGDGATTRASYDWSYKNHLMKRKDYELVFLLLKSVIRKEQRVLDYLESSSLSDLGLRPSSDYASDIQFQLALWKVAYSKMYRSSMDNFDPLIAGFNDVFKKEKFGTKEKLDFLVTFVQNIQYHRPGGGLDVWPPMVTLANKRGDCDTKSLLLYVILEKFGYDCVILWSQHYKHAMLGIYTRGSGDYKERSGKKYYFVETTYPGWRIGQLPPKWDNTRYWYSIKL